MHTPAPVRQVEETFHKINRDPMVAPQQKSGDQQRQKGLSTGDHDHARSMAKKQMLARKIFFFLFFFFSFWSFTSRLSISMMGAVCHFLSPVCSWSRLQQQVFPLAPRKRGCVSPALASLQRLPVNQSELIFRFLYWSLKCRM